MMPRRIKKLKMWQPTQIASTDSAKAKTTIMASSTWLTRHSPVNQQMVAAVVTTVPIAWAKRLGGPGTRR